MPNGSLRRAAAVGRRISAGRPSERFSRMMFLRAQLNSVVARERLH